MLGIFVGILLGACFKFAFLYKGGQSVKPIILEPAPKQKSIMVDVKGEVLKPGVYTLPIECRAYDAIVAAGGLTSDADYIEINLAARLEDGQELDIPNKFELSRLQTIAQSPTLAPIIRTVSIIKLAPAPVKPSLKENKRYISYAQIIWISGIGIIFSLIILIFLIERIISHRINDIG